LEHSSFSVAERRLDSNGLAKTVAEIQLYVIGSDVHQSARAKCSLEGLCDTQVHLMCLLSAYGWLRIIFQEEVRPLPETQGFPLAYNFENIVISGIEPFSESFLSFVPVFGGGGLTSANSIAVAIVHPPDFRLLSSIDTTVVISSSSHSPSPV
jgi:hypothetical protein